MNAESLDATYRDASAVSVRSGGSVVALETRKATQ
jgi:hypothetical protein